MSLPDNYTVFPNVHIGLEVEIGPYVVLGHPPRGAQPGELPLVVGDGCIIRAHSVIYAGTVLGSKVQTGHGVTIREHSKIGDSVSIGSKTSIEHYVVVGNDVQFHGHNLISEYTTIEDDCWIGPHCCITNVLHPRCPKAKECIKGATLKRGAIVGGNTTLAPGVVIGERAFVGAGSVVLHDVPARMVVVGNPARVIKPIDELKCPFGLMEHPYS